jgi:valyl-tRNA synthetase
LQKEADKWQAEVTRADKKLGNERFVANAPEKVVAEQRDKRADYVKKLAATQARIAELKASQA